MLKKLPPIFRNFYALVAAGFLVWMLFFDINDLVNQYFSIKKLDDLEEEKTFYQSKTQEVMKEREEVLSKPHLLEKICQGKISDEEKDGRYLRYRRKIKEGIVKLLYTFYNLISN